ncbi:MAG TPA: SDR family oxidoreductase [Chitinophagaceae bacterium]|nr:SDR family oxidoreductase [Chitinophagaceae bacterium]
MKLIVITGASRGIGKAIAEKFAAQGWDLALCSRSAAEIAAVRQELLGLHPGIRILATATDVSDKGQVESFASAIHKDLGAADILVNNAGIFVAGSLHEEEEGILEQVLGTNLLGPYHLTRSMLKEMIPRRSGHIFNICSTASLKAYPNGGSYSISKFALLGMSRNLREELAPHRIRVTAICAGAVRTDSWKGVEVAEDRMMRPGDLADLIWACWSLPASTVVEEILIRPMDGDLN